jgi:hypothetical protein
MTSRQKLAVFWYDQSSSKDNPRYPLAYDCLAPQLVQKTATLGSLAPHLKQNFDSTGGCCKGVTGCCRFEEGANVGGAG